MPADARSVESFGAGVAGNPAEVQYVFFITGPSFQPLSFVLLFVCLRKKRRKENWAGAMSQ